ncbi:hypothetical protein GWI33_008461 [Rhynchophorus ferrugineus]|uniref:Sphingomyelin phosphodiesterase n=1 Tax=Rhynchophorus ferrugineus TaxID=354439 RepID=A0A834IR21_RHYFE|nr:hypothetical protein GWI33_008461 [Rhynchophorus ferrugineus]
MNRRDKIFSLFLILIICIFKTDQAPIQNSTSFNFIDGWNYKLPQHKSPLLKESQKHFTNPRYTYGKELKIEGFNEEVIISNSTLKHNVFGADNKDIIGLNVSCPICEKAVQFLYAQLQLKVSFEVIKQYFILICAIYSSTEVCGGIFDSYGPELLPVLSMLSDPADACKLLLGEKCNEPDIPAHQWDITFPDTPKPELKYKELTKVNSPVFKVLHLSDTHYDPDYFVGSVTNCKEPLCCRTYSNLRDEEEAIPAGRWGSYEKCDAPKILLENMLNHIALEHPDIDYVIWTGDLPPHDIWNQTKNSNLDVIRDTVEIIFTAFPDKPVFPAIGNHESAPAGNFPPPWMQDDTHSITWLYKEMTNHWLRWLPASAFNTVNHGAFYSVLLRPGFRLISLNTNYCYSLSWWLFLNSTDPSNELKWLVNELQQAEDNNEKVHIIGHVAPGSDDCLKTWSRNFYEIVHRYEGTITGLFYGHSHADEFQVFYETTNYSRPTAVAYLAPSVTSFTNYNPAYRIYYVDGDHDRTTREIIDHETWTFDLQSANDEGNEPNWFKLYSAKEEYEMNSLRPKEWDLLINKMKVNDNLFKRFYRNYYRDSPTMPLCDTDCQNQILCSLKCAKSHSKTQLCANTI